jgi:hypothetical protein
VSHSTGYRLRQDDAGLEYRDLEQNLAEGPSMGKVDKVGKVIVSGAIVVCAALILSEIIARVLPMMGR